MADTKQAAPAADIFDLDDLETGDEATLAIKDTAGHVTTWIWTFYGPGHPKTQEIAKKASKKLLNELKQQRQDRLNGKKVVVDQPSMDELRVENVDNIVARTKGFTPVRIKGETIEFSPETARKLLLDPYKGLLYKQVSEYLGEEENFTRPSAKN